VVPYRPEAVTRKREPTVKKFAGIVTSGAGETAVKVVDVLYAVPSPTGIDGTIAT
jgi:hypothetical protein